jgi:hypothetical protein
MYVYPPQLLHSWLLSIWLPQLALLSTAGDGDDVDVVFV